MQQTFYIIVHKDQTCDSTQQTLSHHSVSQPLSQGCMQYNSSSKYYKSKIPHKGWPSPSSTISQPTLNNNHWGLDIVLIGPYYYVGHIALDILVVPRKLGEVDSWFDWIRWIFLFRDWIIVDFIPSFDISKGRDKRSIETPFHS